MDIYLDGDSCPPIALFVAISGGQIPGDVNRGQISAYDFQGWLALGEPSEIDIDKSKLLFWLLAPKEY